ncbi:MAG TPA: DUF3592 domain-containing protein [Burkholderiaceae bacterium]|nr:DUF3592 domain-containing protein [Burkholderiaceae bacterium]
MVMALALGGLGVHFGLLPLARTLSAAWAVRQWVAVPAQVVSVALDAHWDGEVTTYRVLTRYRYTHQGQTHEATRVGLETSTGRDNLGDWHQQWHDRLAQAQAQGQSVTAWVNPRQPDQALLDPTLRWPMLWFRLPWVVLFFSLGWAAWRVGWRWRPGAQALNPAAPDSAPADLARRQPAGLGLFTVFWCGLTFPLVGIVWSNGAPWSTKAFSLLFLAVGVALLAYSLRQAWWAWRMAATRVHCQPAQPRAGEDVVVSLTVPLRALAVLADIPNPVRLVQYRVDDSGSGVSERLVHTVPLALSRRPALHEGEEWRAQGVLPPDAPEHGGRRAGERVDWRLEILGPKGQVVASHNVPVQAARWPVTQNTAWDAQDPRARWRHEEHIPLDDSDPRLHGDQPPVLPAHMVGHESPDGWQWQFGQRMWRVFAWMQGALLLWALSAWWPEAVRRGAWGGWRFLVLAVLCAGVLHAATRRWTLAVHDHGVTVQVSSWMWIRSRTLPLVALDHLFHKLLYVVGGGASERPYFALYTCTKGAGAQVHRLTPGLLGPEAVVRVAWVLGWCRRQRAGRFTAGVLKPPEPAAWRLGAGVLLWAALLVLLQTLPTGLPQGFGLLLNWLQ